MEKLICHSSRCFGTYPQIDLQTDKNQTIIVNREFFKNKSETDKEASGVFKGVLGDADYNQL